MKLTEVNNNETLWFKGKANSVEELLVSIEHGRFMLDGRHLYVTGPLILMALGLTTLVGCPQHIKGNFDCSHNALRTLVGAPQVVDGNFICSHNKLETLMGGPTKVGGAYDCSFNKLPSLEGVPQHIKSYFWCQFNLLPSLVGGPAVVDGIYNCSDNLLTSFVGCPRTVRSMLIAHNNRKLISLEGGPSLVDGDVMLHDCISLTSLRDVHLYFPEVKGVFFLDNRPLKKDLLGLLFIKGLERVVFQNDKKLEAILNKYLHKGNPLACALELVEAGYNEQAKV
jgi:hypothetical protein